MQDSKECGRTHEPTTRELVAEFDGFKSLVMVELAAIEKLNLEREKRYSQQDASNKEAVRAAFIAVDKMSASNAENLAEYKKGANEWRDTVKDILSSNRGQHSGTATTVGMMITIAGLVALLVFGILNLIVKH